MIGRLWTICEGAVGQAPLDVLGAADVLLDTPAELLERHGMSIGQYRALVARRPVDDLAVAHRDDVRADLARDQCLAEAGDGLDRRDPAVRR